MTVWRNRSQGVGQIELHGARNMPGTAALTTTGVVRDFELPPNAWKGFVEFWSEGNDAALTFSIAPWNNPDRTSLGGPMFISRHSAIMVTALTVAATAADGVQAMHGSVLGGITTAELDYVGSRFGYRVTISAATALSRGTYGWRVTMVPEA